MLMLIKSISMSRVLCVPPPYMPDSVSHGSLPCGEESFVILNKNTWMVFRTWGCEEIHLLPDTLPSTCMAPYNAALSCNTRLIGDKAKHIIRHATFLQVLRWGKSSTNGCILSIETFKRDKHAVLFLQKKYIYN